VKTEKEQEESPGAVACLDSLELESLAGLKSKKEIPRLWLKISKI